MKRIILFLLAGYFFVSLANRVSSDEETKKINIKLFHSSSCKHCIDIKEEYLPRIISKYKVKINIEYLDIAQEENFKLLLSMEEKFNVKAKVPAMLIGNHFLIGSPQITRELDSIISEYLSASISDVGATGNVNLWDKFRKFSPGAVIAAGLIDGINPCAFTVIIFFISFLTLMGYRKMDLALIGSSFILAVFFTYLLIGLGLFKGLYELKNFSFFMRTAYSVIAGVCFILAYFNLRDFFVYRRTKTSDSLKVKLPKAVRDRINTIIGLFYRKDKNESFRPYLILVASAFVAGFLISLLEAVCTGQMYLPTIVFILKEPVLRFKAIFYLVVYNLMFIAPLVLILTAALLGAGSKKIEKFFRNKISLIKLLMFILFLGLGIFLLIGA